MEKEEKQLAVAAGEMDEDEPAIHVIADRVWSTRSHQHRYSPKSGVALIIDERTKKLLYLGGTKLILQYLFDCRKQKNVAAISQMLQKLERVVFCHGERYYC